MRAVVTFHALADDGGVLSFPPRQFARWIEALAAAGIPLVAYDQLMKLDRGVTITFDDGMRSVHQHALPVLRAHGARAHLFLTTGAVGADNAWPTQPASAPRLHMLSWDEVLACAAGGIAIEGHTHSHPDLRMLPEAAIAAECERADTEIQNRLGRRPRLFAYPYGQFDARVRALVARRYEACFSTRMAYLPGVVVDASLVPRIDAYYLRWPWAQARLMSPWGRAYLEARALIRLLRGRR